MGTGAATRITSRLARTLSDRELLPYLVLFGVALALRTIDLTGRPMHHDESLDAWFSWRIAEGNVHRYDPVYHGPLRFYLLAAVQRLFGSGELQVRIVPALLGAGMVLVPISLRRPLGRSGALAAAAMLSVSPLFVYFSRFTREDIYIALCTLIMIALAFRFFDHPNNRAPIALGALVAVSFALKETTFITLFVVATFAALLIVAARTQRSAAARESMDYVIAAARQTGSAPWVWAGTTFLVVFAVAFTGAFTDLESLHRGLFDGLTYWIGQHEVGRGGQPWFFYLVLILAYEWPAVLLAAIGLVAVARRPTLFGLFVTWSFAALLVIYSWAGEKFPWLVIHSTLPLLLLAGLGVQHSWDNERRALRWLGRTLTAIAVAHGLVAGVGAALLRPADGRELVVAVQTTTDVPPIVDELKRLDRRLVEGGSHLVLVIDQSGSAAWPWAWHFRDLPGAAFVSLESAQGLPPADALLVTQTSEPHLRAALAGFEGRRFQLRTHWTPDYRAALPFRWLRWLVSREPWSDVGSYDEWLFIRRDVATTNRDLSTS